MNRKLVTLEVAQKLGIERATLIVYLHRNPELKPRERLPNGDFLWDEDEIKALKERRAQRQTE